MRGARLHTEWQRVDHPFIREIPEANRAEWLAWSNLTRSNSGLAWKLVG
jgi:hypothetical protein